MSFFNRFRDGLNSATSTRQSFNAGLSNVDSVIQGLNSGNNLPDVFGLNSGNLGNSGTGGGTGGTINNLRSKINQNGLAPSNRFVIYMPESVASSTTARDLVFYCESVTMPGTAIMTSDYQADKQSLKFAYSFVDGEVSMTFFLDKNHSQKVYFEEWMSKIINKKNYTIAYKNDYAAPVDIAQLDSKNNVTHAIKLINAYPISVSEVMLASTAENQYGRFNVVFSYDHFEHTTVSNSASSSSISPRNNPSPNNGVSLSSFLDRARNLSRQGESATQNFRNSINRLRQLP